MRPAKTQNKNTTVPKRPDKDAILIGKEPERIPRGNIQLLWDMFKHFTEAMMVTDLDGKIVEANPAFSRLFGYSEREIVGRSIDVLAADPSFEKDRLLHYQAVEKHGAWRGEILRKAKDGSSSILQLTIVPVHDRNEPAGYLYIGIDITEKKQIEHELSHTQDLARLGEMIVSVVHEFKNPLQKLRSSVALLLMEMRPRGKNSQMIIRSLQDGISELNNLFSDLRDFSRPVRLHVTRAGVNTLLDGALRDLRASLSANKIRVHKDYADIKPCRLDSRRMASVFRNLIENAMDAMAENGTLYLKSEVVIRQGVRLVRIRFKDNGKGMKPTEIEQAFDPFFSLKTAGTGMGLAIVKKVVELHGGDIAIKSAPRQGSTFTLTFMAENT
ncbi:MAG: ATP-binding protein [Elusimicrobiota bacterium]